MTQRPDIVTNRDRLQVILEARGGLIETNVPPETFIHGSVLVRVGQDDQQRPLIRALEQRGLRAVLASKIRWVQERRDQEGQVRQIDVNPPSIVVDDLLSRADDLLDQPGGRMPVLDQVVHAPIFAPDGTLVTEPGYAPGARVWYEPVGDLKLPPVPEKPTREQVEQAKTTILFELLGEFPFETPTDRSHALALLLLPFVRAMIDGPTPLHPIDAPTPGTGKGLLAHVLLAPALGDVLPMTPEITDNDEMRKQLTSIFLAGYPVVLFDNVTDRVDSPALSAALTLRTWNDRVLGLSRNATVPVACIFVLTGNNTDYSQEMARRLCPIRLDVTALTTDPDIAEHPWRREIVRKQPLRQWAAEHRGRLVWSALVLVRSWQAAGSPPWSGNPLGSFERWSQVIGGIIEHAGGAGFLANLEQVYDRATSDKEQRHRFVELWWDKYDASLVTTDQLDALTLVVGDIFSLDGAKGNARNMRIGHGLKKMTGQVWAGYRVLKTGRSYHLTRMTKT